MTKEIETFRPKSRDELIQLVCDLGSKGATYAVEGFGTRRTIAAPQGEIASRISLSALDRIERMDGEDMTCRVQCGLRLSDLDASLRDQDLALAPGPFLAPDSRSLGGLFSEAPHSPRGFDRGSLRSQLLGLTGLDGRGREFQAGGRVVKNVAGYDLMKLFVGGGGAWFVGVELELRLIRRPQLTRTLASAPLPIDEALSLWRSLRPTWVDARALDLHLQGDGSAVVELQLAGHSNRVKAFPRPDVLAEDLSGPELWDRMSPHSPTAIPTHRGQIRPSESPTWIESLPSGCRGSLHLQGHYSLVMDEAPQRRGQSGGGMSPRAIELACRLKRGLGIRLAPERLSFETATPKEEQL